MTLQFVGDEQVRFLRNKTEIARIRFFRNETEITRIRFFRNETEMARICASILIQYGFNVSIIRFHVTVPIVATSARYQSARLRVLRAQPSSRVDEIAAAGKTWSEGWRKPRGAVEIVFSRNEAQKHEVSQECVGVKKKLSSKDNLHTTWLHSEHDVTRTRRNTVKVYGEGIYRQGSPHGPCTRFSSRPGGSYDQLLSFACLQGPPLQPVFLVMASCFCHFADLSIYVRRSPSEIQQAKP